MAATREVRIIPEMRDHWRRELDSRRGPDDGRMRIASLWIARDVAKGERPDAGLVWVFRALDRLSEVEHILRKQRQQERAAEHGIVRGATVRVNRPAGPVEGVVGGVDGLFLWFQDGRRDVLISDLSTVEILADGTGLPMRPSETTGRTGKGPDGRARTREAKMAALFTQTTTTDDGHPVRDPESTSYLSTLEPVEHFADLVQAEARRRGSEHLRQLVVLGDGARWIWNLAQQRFPAATQIVDLFHARQHLHELAALLEFIVPDPDTWLTDRLTDLDDGDIEAISAAARRYDHDLNSTKAAEVDKAVKYFETNAHRMRYAYYRKLGMFVGSGVVEAGCKNVLGARLKQSGMHWSTRGATAISTLRCHHASAA